MPTIILLKGFMIRMGYRSSIEVDEGIKRHPMIGIC